MDLLNKKVVIITTGGTIASDKVSASKLLRSGAIPGAEVADKLLTDKSYNCEIIELFDLPSAHIAFGHLKELACKINKIFQDESVSGIVITHGTDTMEETAYFLSLVIEDQRPIAITGSQLPPFQKGSDALDNLNDAVKAVVNPESCSRGVFVVFAKKVFAASEVVKTHSTDVDGFAAPGFGPIGYFDYEGNLIYTRKVSNYSKYPYIKSNARVFIVKFALGMGREIVDLVVKAGTDGIVLQGFGAGQIPPQAIDAIAEIVEKKIPVVLTTRCLQGGIKKIYDYPGSAYQLAKMGVLIAENLTAEKARIRLILAISSGTPFIAINE